MRKQLRQYYLFIPILHIYIYNIYYISYCHLQEKLVLKWSVKTNLEFDETVRLSDLELPTASIEEMAAPTTEAPIYYSFEARDGVNLVYQDHGAVDSKILVLVRPQPAQRQQKKNSTRLLISRSSMASQALLKSGAAIFQP